MNCEQGEHLLFLASPPSLDEVAFHLRRNEFEIRDMIRIQKSDHTWIGILARKHMQRSVQESYVRKGIGHISIDSCRVSLMDSTQSQGAGHEGGRFPTNFILVHEPECEVVGTKTVKSGITGTSDGGFGNTSVVYGDGAISESHGYGDEHGFEKMPEWDCQPSCPVYLLDQQSGERKGWSGQYHSNFNPYGGNSYNESETERSGFHEGYGDEGGASRFFHQATSTDELCDYLETMTLNEVRGVEDDE